jgi:hypothetical protein
MDQTLVFTLKSFFSSFFKNKFPNKQIKYSFCHLKPDMTNLHNKQINYATYQSIL